ncbi:Cas10/Cmr2 second palm domain-containing protein [Algivirga pacifica]|uniref:GGDEF domain-containing protein n=1 Tax=Algivirga pacifica TaxID=1162670 RepID=A0ABP9D8Z5_9BACT
MAKYLYGASVNGIQSFIFETNKLKEIIGGSELVEQICTTLFEKQLGKSLEGDSNVFQMAAGAIKYLFESEEECRKFVKEFPLVVRNHALGVSLTQAVVEVKESLTEDHFYDLEKKLQQARNKAVVQATPASMLMDRSRKTGQAGVEYVKNEVVGEAASQKRKVTEGRYDKEGKGAKHRLYTKIFGEEVVDAQFHELKDLELKHLTSNERTGWIAVIHADGNGLGQLIMSLQEKEIKGSAFSRVMREFSQGLDKATEEAALHVVRSMELTPKDIVPVILGGDDLTVIIRAAKAFEFAELFSKKFEEMTRKYMGAIENEQAKELLKEGLTICTGISYIKYNYPIHYGVNLAEALCKKAKKESKGIVKGSQQLPPSSIMFHRVQASFVEDFTTLVRDELTSQYFISIDENGNEKSHPFVGGPYFLEEQDGWHTVFELNKSLKNLRTKNAPSSPLRQWIGELYVNKTVAAQHLNRIKSVHSKAVEPLNLNVPESNPDAFSQMVGRIHDALTLNAVSK